MKKLLITLVLLLASNLMAENSIPISFPKLQTENDFKASESLFIAKVKWIRDNPLEKDVQIQLNELYNWVGNVPYIKVKHNTNYLPDFMNGKKQYEYFDLLFWLFTYGQVISIIQDNQNQFSGKAIESGLETMIICYKNILKDNQNANWKYMGKFVNLMDKHEISKYVLNMKNKLK